MPSTKGLNDSFESYRSRLIWPLMREVTHQWANDLTILLTNAQLMQSGGAQSPNFPRYSETILKQLQRNRRMAGIFTALGAERTTEGNFDPSGRVSDLIDFCALSILRRREVARDIPRPWCNILSHTEILDWVVIGLAFLVRDESYPSAKLMFTGVQKQGKGELIIGPFAPGEPSSAGPDWVPELQRLLKALHWQMNTESADQGTMIRRLRFVEPSISQR